MKFRRPIGVGPRSGYALPSSQPLCGKKPLKPGRTPPIETRKLCRRPEPARISFRCSTQPSCARMCRRPGQKGARRASARTFARRLHHENPRKIGRLRRHHRLRSDRRRSIRRASLRNPARHRTRHPASRRHLRQRLRQQGQPRGGKGARRRAGHPAQGQRKRQAGLLRPHPLQGKGSHRAGRRTAQALQARRAPLRKDSQELQINRQLRRRPLLDQIRPHRLVFASSVAFAGPGKRPLFGCSASKSVIISVGHSFNSVLCTSNGTPATKCSCSTKTCRQPLRFTVTTTCNPF